ncbi:MAG: hypothetical protein Q9182_004694 [Xanthomendoza sp. 2 TL-2023]
MDTSENPTPNLWAYPSSRPSSTVSHNHVRPSNSNSPAHAAPFVPMFQSPHGTPANQPSERQRRILELTGHNRANYPQYAFNPNLINHIDGSSPQPPFLGHPIAHPHSFPIPLIPQLPPTDNLNEKQRQARDLIIQLDGDKKLLLKSRQQTAAELQRLTSELANLEASQRGMEHLRFIYPLQVEISKMQSFHDSYGTEWTKVEELLELCWAEVGDLRDGSMTNQIDNKRPRVDDTVPTDEDDESDVVEIPAPPRPLKARRRVPTKPDHSSARGSISPPPARNTTHQPCGSYSGSDEGNARLLVPRSLETPSSEENNLSSSRRLIPSPIQLSTVNGLAASNNVDTVGLKDILGDPLIRECWLFNYLIDVDFITSQLDEDTRALVQVKIVHGSWKEEDANRINIEEAAKRYSNVQVITAYMAEMYGTHHSKMIILLRHDDTAQVNILTGNFIVRDWSMCQAVWRSPLLPLEHPPISTEESPGPFLMGSGTRFKKDILAYLNSYGQRRTGSLSAELRKYDFSSVRAALVASVPGKQNLQSINPNQETLWGWPALRHILSSLSPRTPKAKAHIVMQCSSVASLSQKWMLNFQDVLEAFKSCPPPPSPKPRFSLVFPTADEIRRSVDGYACGGSIHMKTQTPAQIKQLDLLKPMLCHWAGDDRPPQLAAVRQAKRRRAGPHIKTYTRFSDEDMTMVDWSMMTSANLSKQAWGEEVNGNGDVRICSYEIGVVVWPALWEDDAGDGAADMVAVFGKDMPDDADDDDATFEDKREDKAGTYDDDETTDGEGGAEDVLQESKTASREKRKIKVGLRMPYDLPLVPYQKDEMPWCASAPSMQPDCMGRTWSGFS